jgi:transcriptional regulator with XRE-family HTH domain
MSDDKNSKAVGELGKRVEARINELGINPSAAGDLAGVDRSLVRFLISGRTSNPRMDTVLKLSRALNCSLDYLFGFTKEVGAAGELPKVHRPAIDREVFERIVKALLRRSKDSRDHSGETPIEEAVRLYGVFEAEADMDDGEEIELRLRLMEKSIEKSRR